MTQKPGACRCSLPDLILDLATSIVIQIPSIPISRLRSASYGFINPLTSQSRPGVQPVIPHPDSFISARIHGSPRHSIRLPLIMHDYAIPSIIATKGRNPSPLPRSPRAVKVYSLGVARLHVNGKKQRLTLRTTNPHPPSTIFTHGSPLTLPAVSLPAANNHPPSRSAVTPASPVPSEHKKDTVSHTSELGVQGPFA